MRLLLAGAFVLLSACSAKVEPVVVSRLLVNAPPELDQRPREREAIRAALVSRLSSERGTRYSPDDRGGSHVLQVEIAASSEAGTDEPGGQRVRVRLRPTGGAPAFETTGEAPNAAPGQEAILAAFSDALTVISRQRVLEAATPSDLIAALGDAEVRVRLFAIQRLGERRVREALAPLMKLLTDETSPEVALRAIGALVLLGDPAAAAPMIELARNKDPGFVLQVVFALGALGGPTAEGYLVTLASGHPVEAVRRGAEDALGEMQRRKASSPARR